MELKNFHCKKLNKLYILIPNYDKSKKKMLQSYKGKGMGVKLNSQLLRL